MSYDDALTEWIDAGNVLVLFKNSIGSYTALSAFTNDIPDVVESRITDDFSPTDATYRLIKKMKRKR